MPSSTTDLHGRCDLPDDTAVIEALNEILNNIEAASSAFEGPSSQGTFDDNSPSSMRPTSYEENLSKESEVRGEPERQSHDGNVTNQQFSQDNRDVFKLRTIQFNSHDYSIVTQNLNGPCPLISVINVLVLKGLIKLPRSTYVTRDALTHLVADALIQMRPNNMNACTESNYDKNLDDVINLLPDLGRGLDVNIRFRNVTDFEFTPALSLFDLLHVNLYHGWLPDPQFVEISKAIGDLTYNQLVEQICDDYNVNRLLLQEFLDENVSQLTYHGLASLTETMHEGELAVLFRNNHFHTVYKRKDLLYLLVSDSGYVNEPFIVWESFNSIDGNSVFFAGDFSFGSPLSITRPEQGVCDTNSDFLLAQQIQRYEDELAMEESKKASRRAVPNEIRDCSSSTNENIISKPATFDKVPYANDKTLTNSGQKEKKEKCTIL